MTASLPASWARCALSLLGEWGSGGTPSRADPGSFGDGTPWLKIGDLPDGPVRSAEESITEKGLANSSAKLLDSGTLLVAMYGSIGKLGTTTFPCATNQAIAFCKPHSGIDLQYLFYALLNDRRHLIELGQGGTQLNISQTLLKAHEVSVAPTREQARIVSRIEELFSEINEGERALERVQTLVERYRQSVLKAAVTGELTRDWRSHHTPVEPAEGQATDAAALPAGWMWTTVKRAGEVRLGRQRAPQHHQGDHMRPYLRVANVHEDRLDLRDVKEMNFTPREFETYALRPGDILLNEGQSPELVGRPAMYRGEIPGCCYQKTLLRFRARPGVLSDYALLVFRYYLHSGRFRRSANITTSIAHLAAERFEPIEFPLPPEAEQSAIVDSATALLARLTHLETELQAQRSASRALREATLKAAFSGHLVPQDPADEPASALLARLATQAADTPAAPRRRGRPAGRRVSHPNPEPAG